MSLFDHLPAPFPFPPVPRGMVLQEVGRKEELKREVEVTRETISDEPLDQDFKNKLVSEGFNEELVDLGLKMADSYSRTREDALKIGESYIRKMAK